MPWPTTCSSSAILAGGVEVSIHRTTVVVSTPQDLMRSGEGRCRGWQSSSRRRTRPRGIVRALGVAIVEAGQVIDRASWLVRPTTLDCNPYNVMIHGFTAADVASALTLCRNPEEPACGQG
jgi:hypothetical protein